MPLYCDSQSALVLMKQRSAGAPGRSKHIVVHCHFIRDQYMHGEISVEFVSTEKQCAGLIFKALSVPKFERAVSGFLMLSPTAHAVAAKKAREKEDADCT